MCHHDELVTEYNLADVVPFIEAVDKTRNQYYVDEIDILKDAVSIPGVSMRYVLNKALKLNPKVELYSPGEPCRHKCLSSCLKRPAKLVGRFKHHARNARKTKLTSFSKWAW